MMPYDAQDTVSATVSRNLRDGILPSTQSLFREQARFSQASPRSSGAGGSGKVTNRPASRPLRRPVLQGHAGETRCTRKSDLPAARKATGNFRLMQQQK